MRQPAFSLSTPPPWAEPPKQRTFSNDQNDKAKAKCRSQESTEKKSQVSTYCEAPHRGIQTDQTRQAARKEEDRRKRPPRVAAADAGIGLYAAGSTGCGGAVRSYSR